MTKITILKPKTAKPDELTIDTVVKLESGLRRVSKLRYGKNKSGQNELYIFATLHEKGKQGIELHKSYHGTGETHVKLTRGKGKLREAELKSRNGKTEILETETLIEAIPTDKGTEINLWKEQGTPLNEIRGVMALNNPGDQSCRNIAEEAKSYPAMQKSKTDYIFEIDVEPTPWIDIKHFLMKPDSIDILEEHLKAIADGWSNIKSIPNLPPPPKKFKHLEKAVIFTNLIPWFVIALFRLSDDVKSSESFQSAQPGKGNGIA